MKTAKQDQSELTPAQRRVYDYIRDCIRKRHLPPTARDICLHFGFRSPKAATDHLRMLERKGVIRVIPGIARGIRILLPDPESGIPILGESPAGPPVLGYQNNFGMLDTNRLFSGRDLFAVRVKGESMRDAGILDGDLVVVRSRPEVPDGAIAVVYVDDEVTIKRVCRKGLGYRLVPENPDYEPIDVLPDTVDFRIGGEVIGVVRVMERNSWS